MNRQIKLRLRTLAIIIVLIAVSMQLQLVIIPAISAYTFWFAVGGFVLLLLTKLTNDS